MVTQPVETDVCIVGAGPAGLVMAHLLARAGVRTLVLERAVDFEREYRGEVLMPRFVRAMELAGLSSVIDGCTQRRLEGLEFHYRMRRLVNVRFSRIAKDIPYALWIPQPILLPALHDACRKLPAFDLWFDATPRALIRDGGKVAGLSVDRGGTRVEVRARVTVGADGRHSTIRRLAGIPLAYEHHDFDVVWFTIPETKGHAVAFQVFLFARLAVLALPKFPVQIQCGILAPVGGLREWKDRGIEAFRRDLLGGPPLIHDFARSLRDFSAFHPLQATVHLAEHWAEDGVLLIGDAAHTCSPAGAIGVSVAVETAMVAAQVVARALAAGDVSAATLGEVQRLRASDVRSVHRIQRNFAARIVLGPPWRRRLLALVLGILGPLGLFSGLPRAILDPKRRLPFDRDAMPEMESRRGSP